MEQEDAPREPFLRACRRLPVEHTPVWFMRQAGRSLPEYRKLRLPGSILETVRRPELAAEITLQPVRRYGVDAAVLYSDIVVPVAAVGFGVEVRPGVGPVVDEPFREESDLKRLRELEPEVDVPHVLQTIRMLRQELKVPLIGFAGAPFTLASYLIEGGPSRDHVKTKTLMRRNPKLWAKLLDRLADISITFLRAQIAAGVQAVQLFDSWVGELNPHDYLQYARPATMRVFDGLTEPTVPRIHFGVGTGELLNLMAEAGADVIGVDWRVPLTRARQRVGADVALQGNLDPGVLLAGWDAAEGDVRRVLDEGRGLGHIFNLGHGVHPTTDPDVLLRVVECCHGFVPA